MADSSVAVTPGAGAAIDTFTLANGDHRQRVIVGDYGGYTGRSVTYRTPGRAVTTGQNLLAIWNAVGSTITVDVHQVTIDLYQTAVKAVTVPPPIIRVVRLTSIPTGGTAGFKNAEETMNTGSTSVTTYQDASADGTSSGTALTLSATAANSASVALSQELAPRLLTAVGYEPADRVEMLNSGPVMCRAGEGLGIRLEYNVATSNPITDMWTATMRWEEYTL
jgi:hypothetical protein